MRARGRPAIRITGFGRTIGPHDARGRHGMATHRIAVIPGDGIGKEVMPEGLRAV